MSAFSVFLTPVAPLAIGLLAIAIIGAHFLALVRLHETLTPHVFLARQRDGASGNIRHLRMARLPLRRRVLALPEAEDPSLDAVNHFADRLADLSVDAWLNIGRAIMNGQPAMADRSAAWSVLTSTISSHNLGVAAWYIRDAVENSTLFADTCGGDSSPSTVRLFSAAKSAAEEAALAILAKRHLPTHEFGILVEPFRDLVTPRPDAPHGSAIRRFG